MNEDLKDIDLAAWDVPEPPDDLADAVVARLGGTDITPAIPEGAPRKHRALLIGGVATALVAVTLGVWTLIGSADRAAPTNGVVVAQFAQQLSLDGVTADLDVGANVMWTRDARTVHVQQRTGSAAWRLAADQRVVINAGTSTVEASGKSSLRVEVKMNKVERAVGASAFAAAAIVTVIVYNGKVTVESPKHERVVVAPGTTYTVEPRDPVDERTVGIAPPTDVTTCDEVSCVLSNYAGACCVRYRPAKLDQADADRAIAVVRGGIAACGEQYTTTGRVVLSVRVADGKVDRVEVTSTPDAALGQCVAEIVKTAAFPVANELTTFTIPFVFPSPIPPPPANCDAKAERDAGDQAMARGQYALALVQYEVSLRCKDDKDVRMLAGKAACHAGNAAKVKKYKATCCDADGLKDKGMEEVNMGEHAKALALFDQSLACKHDNYVVALAFMAACNAQDTAKARLYYGQLSPAQQGKYKMMCDRNHVDVTCDADALKDSGMEKINEGAHAEALALFEQSLACKPDSYVTQLAFMESCNGRDEAKARAYYAKLTPAQQSKYKVICDRNKVDLFDTTGDPKGYLQVFSKPEAKILVDGVDTGLTTPIKGKALALAPGRHKVTFVIGADRYSYFVQTKVGQTDTMTKDLQ